MTVVKIRPTLTILSILSLISCQRIIDNLREEEANENYVSPFKGVYKGNYSGDEVGSLTIEVAQNGYISVTKVSQFSTENSFVSGMVRDDGALQSVTLQSGFTLLGNLKTKSGTWKMGDWVGNWSVTKQ
ncbi:hypothetical protein H0S70_08660 [Chryseobacterium manosquense]|uniref:Uncharacterized protein n=1 Tax=Chryseobacterium manosquense TaxID=2754694 RepID=A0A7H1E0H6_9FLAO|nr:hypothetical protein H0S70_08660 [Chryseobacterium manosquense]